MLNLIPALAASIAIGIWDQLLLQLSFYFRSFHCAFLQSFRALELLLCVIASLIHNALEDTALRNGQSNSETSDRRAMRLVASTGAPENVDSSLAEGKPTNRQILRLEANASAGKAWQPLNDEQWPQIESQPLMVDCVLCGTGFRLQRKWPPCLPGQGTECSLQVAGCACCDEAFNEWPEGYGYLHVAAEKGHNLAVEALLHSRASVEACTQAGITPLMISADQGNLEMVKFLLEERAGLHSISDAGRTALHFAAKSGSLELVSFLLEHLADINTCGSDGVTPLWFAVNHNHFALVKELLGKRAEANARSSHGLVTSTVLHQAVYLGSNHIVKLLVQARASLFEIDDVQQTPHKVASVLGHTQLLPVLQPHKVCTIVDAIESDAPPVNSELAAQKADLKKRGLLHEISPRPESLFHRDAVTAQPVIELESGELLFNYIFLNRTTEGFVFQKLPEPAYHEEPVQENCGCPIIRDWDTLDIYRLTEMLLDNYSCPLTWNADTCLDPWSSRGQKAWKQVQAVFNLYQLFSSSNGTERTLYACKFGSEPRAIPNYQAHASNIVMGIPYLLSQGGLLVCLSMFESATANLSLRAAATCGLSLGCRESPDCLRLKVMDLIGVFPRVTRKGMRKYVIRHICKYGTFLGNLLDCMRTDVQAAVAGALLLQRLLISISSDFNEKETSMLVEALSEQQAMSFSLELVSLFRIWPSDASFGKWNSEANGVKLLHWHMDSVNLLLKHETYDRAVQDEDMRQLAQSLINIIVEVVLTKEQIRICDRQIQQGSLGVSAWSKAKVVMSSISTLVNCFEKMRRRGSEAWVNEALEASGQARELQAQVFTYWQMTGEIARDVGEIMPHNADSPFVAVHTSIESTTCSNSINSTSAILISILGKGRFSQTQYRKALGLPDSFSIKFNLPSPEDSDTTFCCNPLCRHGIFQALPRDEVHLCGGCGMSSYCSKGCAKGHWSNHKCFCSIVQRLSLKSKNA